MKLALHLGRLGSQTGLRTCNSAGLEPRLCDAMWSHSEQQGSKFIKGVVETLCYEEGDSGRDSVAKGGLTFAVEFRDVACPWRKLHHCCGIIFWRFPLSSTFIHFRHLPVSRRLCQEGHFGVELRTHCRCCGRRSSDRRRCRDPLHGTLGWSSPASDARSLPQISWLSTYRVWVKIQDLFGIFWAFFGHFWSESAFGHPLFDLYALISHAHSADGVFPGPSQACGMLGVKYHSVLMRSGRVLNEAGPEQSRVAGSGPGSCFTVFSCFFMFQQFDSCLWRKGFYHFFSTAAF